MKLLTIVIIGIFLISLVGDIILDNKVKNKIQEKN